MARGAKGRYGFCMRVMKWIVAGALVTLAGTAAADETVATPGRTTIRTVVVVGNARRPVVTIELARQKVSVPLHELKRIEDKASSGAGPF